MQSNNLNFGHYGADNQHKLTDIQPPQSDSYLLLKCCLVEVHPNTFALNTKN